MGIQLQVWEPESTFWSRHCDPKRPSLVKGMWHILIMPAHGRVTILFSVQCDISQNLGHSTSPSVAIT